MKQSIVSFRGVAGGMTYVWLYAGLWMVGGAGVGIVLAGNSAFPNEKL